MPLGTAQRRILFLGSICALGAFGWLVLTPNEPQVPAPTAAPIAPRPAPTGIDNAMVAIETQVRPMITSVSEPPETQAATESGSAREISPPPTPPPRTAAEIDRDDAVISVAMELVRTNPVQALRNLAELPPSTSRDAAIAHSVAQWAAVAPDAAKAWVSEMPTGGLRENVSAAAAVAWAERDPKGAADWVATKMDEGIQQRNAAVAVAQRWVQVDAPAAAEWVTQFPAKDLRRNAMDALLRVWWTQDALAAERWVASQKTTDFHEEVAGVFQSIRGEREK